MKDDTPASSSSAGFAQAVRDNLYRIGGQAVQSATPYDAQTTDEVFERKERG